MSSGQNLSAVSQISGNVSLAMNQLAGMNSSNPAVQSALNQTMNVMKAVAKAGKAMAKDCASA